MLEISAAVPTSSLLRGRVRGGALGQCRQVGGVEVGRHLDAAVDPDEDQARGQPGQAWSGATR
ncbi:hypothetical protein ACNKF0_12960 [Nocardioides sp. T5]|uniref:hypothetical protein n=1 Tax=Nocardioides sp. T5 TaxID=3400182 RepID=UPI003A85C162